MTLYIYECKNVIGSILARKYNYFVFVRQTSQVAEMTRSEAAKCCLFWLK